MISQSFFKLRLKKKKKKKKNAYIFLQLIASKPHQQSKNKNYIGDLFTGKEKKIVCVRDFNNILKYLYQNLHMKKSR